MAHVETQRSRRNKLLNLTNLNNCRKFSFKKRKSTLKKKVAQLNTLCDVNVCMICFGPDQTVETWPANNSDVLDLIFKYKGLSEKAKQKYNLVRFMGEKKRKLHEKLKNKMMKEQHKRKNIGESTRTNVWRTFSSWDEKLNLFSGEELVSFCGNLDNKLQVLSDKIKLINQEKNEKAVVIHNKEASHNNINRLNQVCQSIPSKPGLVQFNNGDCCLYNQQAFSGFDIDLQNPKNFRYFGTNYGNNYMGNDVINSDIVLHNDLLQGFVHPNRVLRKEESYGFAREGNSLNNCFCSDGLMNSQMLYNVLPMPMRLPLLFSDGSAQ